MKKKAPAKARPKAVRGEAKRAELIAAARDLFLSKDYDDVSMDDVVAKAGGSKATIYKFFGTKEGLLRAVVVAFGREIAESAKPPAQLPDLPIEDVLMNMMRTVIRIILSREAMGLYRVCAGLAHRMPGIADYYFKYGGPEMGTKAWAVLLAELTRQGRLNMPDPLLAAKMLGGSSLNYPTLEFMLGQRKKMTDAEVDVLARETVRIGLAAYGPKT